MGYTPDEYVAECVKEAGPIPWLHFIRSAIRVHYAGFGSKSKEALEGRAGVGSAMVALNGNPLAFFGGWTRDETHRYPGDDRPVSEVPDVLAELERALTAPQETTAALSLGFDLVQALIDARNAGQPMGEAIAALEDWTVNHADLVEED